MGCLTNMAGLEACTSAARKDSPVLRHSVLMCYAFQVLQAAAVHFCKQSTLSLLQGWFAKHMRCSDYSDWGCLCSTFQILQAAGVWPNADLAFSNIQACFRVMLKGCYRVPKQAVCLCSAFEVLQATGIRPNSDLAFCVIRACFDNKRPDLAVAYAR